MIQLNKVQRTLYEMVIHFAGTDDVRSLTQAWDVARRSFSEQILANLALEVYEARITHLIVNLNIMGDLAAVADQGEVRIIFENTLQDLAALNTHTILLESSYGYGDHRGVEEVSVMTPVLLSKYLSPDGLYESFGHRMVVQATSGPSGSYVLGNPGPEVLLPVRTALGH